jgi:succinate dehydrogenase/fumarate reductase cytochrome b subunit
MNRPALVFKLAEETVLSRLARLPIIGAYSKNRGWPFVLSWAHRITGILLLLYVCVHLVLLSSLKTPGAFDSKMKMLSFFLFVFLEWLLAIPVIFHALNGGRLILYESFRSRIDHRMIRWVLGLSVAYVLFLGMMMFMGDQNVSPVLFWLAAMIFGISLVYIAATRIWTSKNTVFWRIHRISGAYLFIMIPAHLLFMHINPANGHEAAAIIARMQSFYIKLVDLTLVLGVLYHAGYGVVAMAKDYIDRRAAINAVTILVAGLMVFFAWVGISLIAAV